MSPEQQPSKPAKKTLKALTPEQIFDAEINKLRQSVENIKTMDKQAAEDELYRIVRQQLGDVEKALEAEGAMPEKTRKNVGNALSWLQAELMNVSVNADIEKRNLDIDKALQSINHISNLKTLTNYRDAGNTMLRDTIATRLKESIVTAQAAGEIKNKGFDFNRTDTELVTHRDHSRFIDENTCIDAIHETFLDSKDSTLNEFLNSPAGEQVTISHRASKPVGTIYIGNYSTGDKQAGSSKGFCFDQDKEKDTPAINSASCNRAETTGKIDLTLKKIGPEINDWQIEDVKACITEENDRPWAPDPAEEYSVREFEVMGSYNRFAMGVDILSGLRQTEEYAKLKPSQQLAEEMMTLTHTSQQDDKLNAAITTENSIAFNDVSQNSFTIKPEGGEWTRFMEKRPFVVLQKSENKNSFTIAQTGFSTKKGETTCQDIATFAKEQEAYCTWITAKLESFAAFHPEYQVDIPAAWRSKSEEPKKVKETETKKPAKRGRDFNYEPSSESASIEADYNY